MLTLASLEGLEGLGMLRYAPTPAPNPLCSSLRKMESKIPRSKYRRPQTCSHFSFCSGTLNLLLEYWLDFESLDVALILDSHLFVK